MIAELSMQMEIEEQLLRKRDEEESKRKDPKPKKEQKKLPAAAAASAAVRLPNAKKVVKIAQKNPQEEVEERK